jgi:hypothetical protein
MAVPQWIPGCRGSAGVQQIVYLATGSHRYEIRFRGPGEQF